MFILNPDLTVLAIKVESELNYVVETAVPPFGTERELSELAARMPGESLVAIWNKLPGVTQIVASEKEQARGRKAKFRNRQTGVARIWAELCRLYPDAVSSEDMKHTHKRAPQKVARAKHFGKARAKRDQVVALLKRKRGATVEDICKMTGWKRNAATGILQWISWAASLKLSGFTSQDGKHGRIYRAA